MKNNLPVNIRFVQDIENFFKEIKYFFKEIKYFFKEIKNKSFY